jgi:hypothetical protein
MACRASAVLAIAALAIAGVARAEVAGISFDWSAPDGCPDDAAARAAIAHYAGESAFGPSYPVNVRVVLAPEAEGDWRGRVELRSPEGRGHRDFRGATCEEVAQASTLIVAIMLDPLKTAAKVRAAEAGLAESRRAEAPLEPGGDRTHVDVGVVTSADHGSLPSASLGVGLEASVRAGIAMLEAQGTYWVPQRVVAGPSPFSGGQIGLYSGGLRGCVDAVRSHPDVFRLGVCLHGELGVATGTGFGIDEPVHSSALWGAGFVGLSAWLASSPLATWLTLEMGTPLSRPVYGIDGFGEVFRASPVLLRGSTGVAWTFP